MENIKPCPFCGKEQTIKVTPYKSIGRSGWQMIDTYQIQCSKCGVIAPASSTREAVIMHWNTRKGVDK